MLTDAELDALRATATAALPETCTITRSSAEPDGFGGITTEAETIAEEVPCRVGAPTRQELSLLAEHVAEVVGIAVTLPHGTDVAGGDTLAVGERTFTVAAAPRRTWATAVRALCWEVGR